jgi:hypothetical protein
MTFWVLFFMAWVLLIGMVCLFFKAGKVGDYDEE